MGTIVIEEYNAVGSDANRDAPVVDLSTLKATTVDATTSTTAESVTAGSNTRLISVYAVETHRLATGTDTTTTTYAVIPAGQVRDFAIDPETILYYRADA